MPKKTCIRDCTQLCNSKIHANSIISAITYPLTLVLDKQVAAFLNNTCCCFDTVRDDLGRTALHISASCGRKDLCQWLINYGNADINAREFESGYTPLHKSILYGFMDVAVTLIRLGADLNIRDFEDYCPLDLITSKFEKTISTSVIRSKFAVKQSDTKDENFDSSDSDVSYIGLSRMAADKRKQLDYHRNAFVPEVYTWGINQNYTDGFGAEKSKTCPEYLEFFDKRNEVIIDIYLNKYHTIFVSAYGNAWSCGLGQGGRLGLGSEHNVLIPQKINFVCENPVFCIKAATGHSHSIFLCNDNQVFACGLNIFYQLGLHPPPIIVTKPEPVNIEALEGKLIGVAASGFCSVLWTSQVLYTCGLNGGQLGYEYSPLEKCSKFKKVHFINLKKTKISHVGASDGAIVVITEADNIYVLHNYACQKIEFRGIKLHMATNIFKTVDARRGSKRSYSSTQMIKDVSIIGGSLDSKKIKNNPSFYKREYLKIVLLLSNGNLYLWTEKHDRLISCNFEIKRQIKVSHMVINSNNMMLAIDSGEMFVAWGERLEDTLKKNTGSEYTTVAYNPIQLRDECYIFKLEKVPNAYRTVAIFSDTKGDNFALLQQRSANVVIHDSVIKSTLKSDIEKFYQESIEIDQFHDVTYKVGSVLFPAHRYLIAYFSEELAFLKASHGIITIKDAHPDIFKEILLYVYTGTCNLFKTGSCSIKIPRSNDKSPSGVIKYEDPIKLAIKLARSFRMNPSNNFLSTLDKFKYEKETISFKSSETVYCKMLILSRSKYKNLYDIKIRSKDGQLFHAHRCILTARMEYFKMMLSGFWIESSDHNDEFCIPVAGDVLLEMLDFLYTDNVGRPILKKDLNFWCSLLVAADQFLLPTLKNIAENALVQCLDTRNTVDVVLFAEQLNADNLIQSCIEFIANNMNTFLQLRTLEKLNDNFLTKLTEFYRELRQDNFSFKPVPVYSNVCDPEIIINIADTSPVEWETVLECENSVLKKKQSPLPQKKKSKPVRKTSTKSEYKEKKIDEVDKTIPFIISEEDITSIIIKEKVDPEPQLAIEKNWVAVERHLKSIKSSIKINSAVKKCPELTEQKENFVILGRKSEEIETESEELMSKNSPIKINIDLENLKPKLSQKQRRKLRTLSESSSSKPVELESSKKTWNLTSPSCDNSTELDCWNVDKSPEVSLSAIMKSERKQKNTVKKETKKIETKSLNMTQIEDQAIQELISFYNAQNVEDECITVDRVYYRIAAPQWVVK